MTIQEEYEVLKAKYYMLESQYEKETNELKSQMSKEQNDYNGLVDDYNDLADRYNALNKQVEILTYDNDKYRKLYFAAKNKLEYNGIPFSEFKVLEEYGLA